MYLELLTSTRFVCAVIKQRKTFHLQEIIALKCDGITMKELIALMCLSSLGFRVFKTTFINIPVISSITDVFAEETCARR